MGLFSFLTGGKSKVEGVKYPEWYSDPKFTGSQDFLDQYSRDLLTKGPNDYYAPIGQYGSDEFLNYINVSANPILEGTRSAAAASGRARGGQLADVTTDKIAKYNLDLVFKDYIRAMEGRQWLMGTGLGVQQDVRNYGFANQTNRNDFKVGGAEFDLKKASYLDNRDDAKSAAIGKMIGAGLGFVATGGNPYGAMAGASMMGGSGGGTDDTMKWLDVLGSSKKATTGASNTGVSSDIGAIKGKVSNDKLMELLSGLR